MQGFRSLSPTLPPPAAVPCSLPQAGGLLLRRASCVLSVRMLDPLHSHLRTSSGCVGFPAALPAQSRTPLRAADPRHASALSDACLGSLPSSPPPGPCPCRGLGPHVREHVRRVERASE